MTDLYGPFLSGSHIWVVAYIHLDHGGSSEISISSGIEHNGSIKVVSKEVHYQGLL